MTWPVVCAVFRGDERAALERSVLWHRKALPQPGQVSGSPCFAGQGKFKDGGPARIECEAEKILHAGGAELG